MLHGIAEIKLHALAFFSEMIFLYHSFHNSYISMVSRQLHAYDIPKIIL